MSALCVYNQEITQLWVIDWLFSLRKIWERNGAKDKSGIFHLVFLAYLSLTCFCATSFHIGPFSWTQFTLLHVDESKMKSQRERHCVYTASKQLDVTKLGRHLKSKKLLTKYGNIWEFNRFLLKTKLFLVTYCSVLFCFLLKHHIITKLPWTRLWQSQSRFSFRVFIKIHLKCFLRVFYHPF